MTDFPENMELILPGKPESDVPAPSLFTYGGAPKGTVALWFLTHKPAEHQCATFMMAKGLQTTLKYLKEYYDFPFSDDALRDHARKLGWI